jgi:hypothetical protein
MVRGAFAIAKDMVLLQPANTCAWIQPTLHSVRASQAMPRRFYNNVATNCADPSRSDFHAEWCSSFRAQCDQLRNTTGAAQAAVRRRGRAFLGADIDLPCQTWNGEGNHGVIVKSHLTVCFPPACPTDGLV